MIISSFSIYDILPDIMKSLLSKNLCSYFDYHHHVLFYSKFHHLLHYIIVNSNYHYFCIIVPHNSIVHFILRLCLTFYHILSCIFLFKQTTHISTKSPDITHYATSRLINSVTILIITHNICDILTL